MVEYKIIYFNNYHLKHSEEKITIPVHLLIGVSQDYIIDILKDKRKYKAMDCVFICTVGHADVNAFIPYLLKTE